MRQQRLCWYCRKPLARAKKTAFWLDSGRFALIHLRCSRRAKRISRVEGYINQIFAIEDRSFMLHVLEASN